jgi:hypothetical protein
MPVHPARTTSTRRRLKIRWTTPAVRHGVSRSFSARSFQRSCTEGEKIPQRGWAIEDFAQVYKDGQAAGLFIGMTIDKEGKSVLDYEFIGKGPPTSELLR